jgi:hypothetical protein
MRHPNEFIEPIFQKIVANWILRTLARVLIVWLTFLFVVNTAVAIDLEKWALVAICTLNLGVYWWCIKRLWPPRKERRTTKGAV